MVEVLEIGDGRAISTNGIHWHIQVRHNLNKPKWGSLENVMTAARYVRYGIWSKADGLNRSQYRLAWMPVK